jgi:cyclic pyranopterin phosphate synthase
MEKLTHIDNRGKAVMVDIGDKENQLRIAKASGHISLSPETIRLAGISSAKKTSDLIPLCHNIVLENVKVDAIVDKKGVKVDSEVRCYGKTGVEMEALTAVSVALLTVYDMCKAVDKNMIIDRINLKEKIKK